MKSFFLSALLGLLALAPAGAQTAPEVRTVAGFQTVEVSNGIELRLAAGEPQRVEVSADTPELRERIKTTVSGGVLKISFDRQNGEAWNKKIRVRNLRVSVTAPPLAALAANSGAEVEVAGPYAPAANLQLEISSGATLRGSFTAPALEARVSSGGVATLAGKTQSLAVRASSGGVFKGADLQAATCEASASSGGTVAVAVQETLTASASSGGDVRYTGSPKVTKRTGSGGSVRGQ